MKAAFVLARRGPFETEILVTLGLIWRGLGEKKGWGEGGQNYFLMLQDMVYCMQIFVG